MAAFVEYNPTMATASMTMASHSVDFNPSVTSSSIDHHVESREESIEKLKSNLVRYARSNDRRMVLRSLKDVSFLSYIPMEAPNMPSDVSMAELEKEVLKEKVILNETLLNPPSDLRTLPNAGTNSGCPVILKGLSKNLCRNSTMNAGALYKRVLFRLAKTSASDDVYSYLNSIMGSPELAVQKLSSDYAVKSNAAIVNRNKDDSAGEPSDLKLYNTGGQIHMVVESAHYFGLFRTTDTRPWIVMKCKIHERTNFSNNEGFRSLSVKTPNLY